MTLQTNNNNLDITNLGYKKINDKYSKANYLGLECIMDMTSGYINATKLCDSFGNIKQVKSYLKSDRCKNLILYFEEPGRYRPGSISVLIKENAYGELRGTYLHPDLLLDVASWISPDAYFKASRIVNNYLIKEKEDEIRGTKILLG